MNNADQPAMPQSVTYGPDGSVVASYDFAGGAGLTKREHLAAAMNIGDEEISFNDKATLEGFIGRTVVQGDTLDMIRAVCEMHVKYRVMKADALLAELERTS